MHKVNITTPRVIISEGDEILIAFMCLDIKRSIYVSMH